MTLQSLGLKIDRSRAIVCDPLQLAVEVHLGLPFFLLEIVLSPASTGTRSSSSGSGSCSGSGVNSRGGYVVMESSGLMLIVWLAEGFSIIYSFSLYLSASHSLTLSLSHSLKHSFSLTLSSSHTLKLSPHSTFLSHLSSVGHIPQARRAVNTDTFMRLLISSVTLDIVQRAYDTTIAVAVGSLYVEDSSRPAQQRFLILSKNLNNQGMLLEQSDHLPPGPVKCHSHSISHSHSHSSSHPHSDCDRDPDSRYAAAVVRPFATIAVCQIFDCLSPYKKSMDLSVHNTLKPRSAGRGDIDVQVVRGDVEVLRELDEGLTIRAIGLSISVDARAVRQVHEIVEPVFACIFSSPVDTAFDTAHAPLDGSGIHPMEGSTVSSPDMRLDGDDLTPCPRGRAVGCLENEWGDRGRHYTELMAQVKPGQEMVRALLKLDLRVDAMTVDMLKVLLSLTLIISYFHYSPHLHNAHIIP